MDEFEATGLVHFEKASFEAYKKGFLSTSVSDELTIATIKETFEAENYLLDPHGAVSLAAVDLLEERLNDYKLICLATAHPAKFPLTIQKSLDVEVLPEAATHQSIETARKQCQKGYTSDLSHLEEALLNAMDSYWEQTKGTTQIH